MKHKKEKTTVLFVNKSSDGLRPVQVSTAIIRNWRKYVAFIIIVFISLVGAVIYLCSNKVQEQKMQLALVAKIHSMHTLFQEVDTSSIRKKFITIDRQMSSINSFLKARGITALVKEPQGGEENSDFTSADEVISFYENYLTKVAYNISYTPIGLPFHGSITSTFGHRENPFGGDDVETHKGLDIKGPMGAIVKAMAKGEVIFAGVRGGFGNCVILKHGNGFQTLYGHLSKIAVNAGQKIYIGQQIGNIGSTGRSTGPHLHYEVRRNGQQINPQPFLTLN